MKKKAKILEYLEIVAPILPSPLYWFDINNVALGANEEILKASGARVREAYVGRSYHELYHERADKIVAHNKEIMETGKILAQEEPINDITTGELKYFKAVKGPLYDDDGNIIGIVGTSIDITAEKEAEHLKIENEAHKVQLQAQEEFTKIAAQVAHDIKSPTASLLMLLKSCQDIPEKERIALREATMRIQDITSNLLQHYSQQNTHAQPHNEEREPLLASTLTLELLAEKKLQYQDLPIKFEDHFSQAGHFAFIKMESSNFKRMLSNLINNAVDAFENKKGKVVIRLDANNEFIKIIIEDNGKGMHPELANKIINNIAVTEGKKGGHGIGLTQVRETLQRNQGQLTIESKVSIGTKIILTFPRIKAPSWIAEKIKLGYSDTIVILDDDNSIHGAWDTHFESILNEALNIQLKHFTEGKEAINFIKSLSDIEKRKILLLTDYELLKQDLNGLDVIEQTELQRSILVTSHYANQTIRERAQSMGTKILPKLLASEIPIIVDRNINYDISNQKKLKHVDLILVDDDKNFTDNLLNYIFFDKTVDRYQDPQLFLKEALQYPKDTKICIDNNFEGTVAMKGLDIAKKLHELGFTKLYLLSGDAFKRDALPNYLTAAILKEDIESIRNI